MPKNRTAVVTEAVRFCFFLFFLGSQFFLHFAVVVVVVVVLVVVLLPREKTETRELSREPSRGTFIFLRERDSFAFDSVARRRLCSSRDLQVVASLVARAEIFFVFRPHKKFYPRERQKSLFRFLAAKKTSLSLPLCLMYKDKK